MDFHLEVRSSRCTPRSRVRERPLHWCIILLSLLFIFLLVVESVAFLVLGAWHLASWHLRTALPFTSEVQQREIVFGILLLLIGSTGVLMSILGLVAFFTLRLLLLRAFAVSLWVAMVVGIAVGVIGIVFAAQVDEYMRQSTSSNLNEYAEGKFMLGMSGCLALSMSLTLLIGIIIVRYLTGDVNIQASDRIYRQP